MSQDPFLDIVQSIGCRFQDRSIVYDVEPSLFRREMKLKLKGGSNYPDNLEQFFDAMNAFVSEAAQLRQCLLPGLMNTSGPEKVTAVDSLFKSLLSIDILQPALISYLLERLPEFFDELEQDQSSSCTARLILHQLRWLDYIVKPQQLANTLIEIIQITPTVIQHEIITALPDIMNDTEHKPIVAFLKDWMQQHPNLTVPILDTLSNLTVHADSLDDVRQMVLDGLSSADVDDLAVMIKFLLQTVTTHTVDTTIFDIRQNLDMRALVRLQQTPQQSSDKPAQSPEALILESIKLGIQFHRFVHASWIKSLLALETPRGHKVIDLLVLLIFYSMASTKKKTEGIIRKKIMAGLITSRLIKEVLVDHAAGLASYWGTIVVLAESLLRSSQQDLLLTCCAQALYTHAFIGCDAYHRQEMIGSLVTHVGSGVADEMNVALQVLLTLAQKHPKELAVYSVFLKGILDYLDSLTLLQIRILFDVFNLLALKGNEHITDDSSLWSDINIVVRKQLSNPRVKYKKIGILGAMSSIKVLNAPDVCCEQSSGGAGSSTQGNGKAMPINRNPLLRQAIQLVDMVMRSCTEYPACKAMALDELAFVLDTAPVDPRFVEWTCISLAESFGDIYTIESSDRKELQHVASAKEGIQPTSVLDYNEEPFDLALNLYGLIIPVDEKKRKIKMITMCSHFNLLQVCIRKMKNDSLVDLDAMLACRIFLFDVDAMDSVMEKWSLEHEELACHMLYITINWVREVINCFCPVYSDPAVLARLIHRLKNLTTLEKRLDQLLPLVSQFVPLELQAVSLLDGKEASFGTPIIKPTSVVSSSTVHDSDNESLSTNTTSTSKRVTSGKAAAPSSHTTVDQLRPYLRPIKIQALSLLNATSREMEPKLSMADVNYLLEDVVVKLESKIVVPSHPFFGKKKSKDDRLDRDISVSRMTTREMLMEVIRHMPKILRAMEMSNELLQEDATQSGRIAAGSEDIAKCMFLVMTILNKLISCPEMAHPENQDLLEAFIRTLSHQLAMDVTQKTFMDECKYAFQYLAGFQENMPQFKTAVSLFKTLERMAQLSCSADLLHLDMQKVAADILGRDWFDWRECPKDVPYLLEKVIELSGDPLSVLTLYVNTVLPMFEREGRLPAYPMLTELTVVSYYQAILNQTVKVLDLLVDEGKMVDVVLIQTGQVVTIFESITSYVKVQDKRALFGLLLKSSRFFIEQFTRHSIPFFTKIFKAHKNDIVAIFRTFQMATRMLQTICSHVKVIKDIQLASYVPPLKKAMEIVIYQVKILLSENNAPADVFFLGALKHRDLSGAPVSSQIPKDDDSEESQDELLSDTSPPTSKTPVSLPKARLTKGSKQSATRTRPSASTSSVLQGLPRTADEILDSDDDADECGSDTSDQIRLLLPTTRSLLPGRHLSPVLPQREPLDVDALAESDTDDDSNSNEDDPVSPVPGRKTTSMIISDSDTDDDDQPSPLTKTFDLTRRPSASNRSTSGYFPPKKSGHQSSNDAPVAPASRKRSYGMTGPKKRLRPM